MSILSQPHAFSVKHFSNANVSKDGMSVGVKGPNKGGEKEVHIFSFRFPMQGESCKLLELSIDAVI